MLPPFALSSGECGTPKQGSTNKQKENRKRSSFSVTLNLQVGLVPVWWGDSLEGPASRCSDSWERPSLLPRQHRPSLEPASCQETSCTVTTMWYINCCNPFYSVSTMESEEWLQSYFFELSK